MDGQILQERAVYRSAVYPDGIYIGTVRGDAGAAQSGWFAGQAQPFALPEGLNDKEAVLAVCYSVAREQLAQAKPRMGDTLLIVAESTEGLITLSAAGHWGLPVFYCDPDAERRALAERMGAAVFKGTEGLAEALKARTDGEGPNIIIDLTDFPGRLSLLVNTVLSQAGRIVLGCRGKGMDAYQMRMGSYKEVDIIGLDRCTRCTACPLEEWKQLKPLLGQIKLQPAASGGRV